MQYCVTLDGVPVEDGGGGGALTTFYNAVYESSSFSTSSTSYVQVTGSTLTLPGSGSNPVYILHWQAELRKSTNIFEIPHIRCYDTTNAVEIGEGVEVGDLDGVTWEVEAGFKQVTLGADATYQLQLKRDDFTSPVYARKCRLWALLIG
jgi:hypothetical protein